MIKKKIKLVGLFLALTIGFTFGSNAMESLKGNVGLENGLVAVDQKGSQEVKGIDKESLNEIYKVLYDASLKLRSIDNLYNYPRLNDSCAIPFKDLVDGVEEDVKIADKGLSDISEVLENVKEFLKKYNLDLSSAANLGEKFKSLVDEIDGLSSCTKSRINLLRAIYKLIKEKKLDFAGKELEIIESMISNFKGKALTSKESYIEDREEKLGIFNRVASRKFNTYLRLNEEDKKTLRNSFLLNISELLNHSSEEEREIIKGYIEEIEDVEKILNVVALKFEELKEKNKNGISEQFLERARYYKMLDDVRNKYYLKKNYDLKEDYDLKKENEKLKDSDLMKYLERYYESIEDDIETIRKRIPEIKEQLLKQIKKLDKVAEMNKKIQKDENFDGLYEYINCLSGKPEEKVEEENKKVFDLVKQNSVVINRPKKIEELMSINKIKRNNLNKQFSSPRAKNVNNFNVIYLNKNGLANKTIKSQPNSPIVKNVNGFDRVYSKVNNLRMNSFKINSPKNTKKSLPINDIESNGLMKNQAVSSQPNSPIVKNVNGFNGVYSKVNNLRMNSFTKLNNKSANNLRNPMNNSFSSTNAQFKLS